MDTGITMGLAVFLAAAAARAAGAGPGDRAAEAYLGAVRTFADKVLRHGRDTFGPRHTPLFVDGLNVDTLEPVVWRHKGDEWVLSNLASQQNLLRALVGLSAMTGDARYRQAAVAAVRHAFDHLQDRGGLLEWGGHVCYDVRGDRIVGEGHKHEFKHHYPYYELMWQVAPHATRRLLEGVWAAHVRRWDILEVDRHGAYGREGGCDWSRPYKGGPVPFVSSALPFMMSGTDIILAGAMLHKLTGEEMPLVWAKRLARRYVEARHPKTHLGASNFSVLPSRRIEKQFPQFNGRFTEATVTDLYGCRYTFCAICQLRIGQMLGQAGGEFRRWALEDLTARANYGYDPNDNTFHATLIDGTPIGPADRKQDGYVMLQWLQKRPGDGRYLLAYALAWRMSVEAVMWRMTRDIARGMGLGVMGERPGEPGQLNGETACDEPLAIFALLELHEATGRAEFLHLARRVGDNVLAGRVHNGLFVPGREYLNARVDDECALALLHLDAALRKLPHKPPTYWAGRGFLHCAFDGQGRTYDRLAIYGQKREPPAEGPRR